MENYIRSCLQGEILIPLENHYRSDHIQTKKKSPNNLIPKTLSLKNLFDYDYKSFRSTVFKNEFLHFYLIIYFDREENANMNLNKTKNFEMNINDLNEYIQNSCSMNIQYKVKEEEEIEEENFALAKNQKNKEDITFTLEENKDMKYVNNGILIKKEILEDKNIIIYELYSKIRLKDKTYMPNSDIEMTITITPNKVSNNLYSDIDANDIHIINYINLDNDGIINKKYPLLNITKVLSVVNPLNINHMGQFDCGNNKYLLTIKIENITYKINFLDQTLKDNKFLKKKDMPDDEFLYFEFPIIITDVYINGDKTSIEDLIYINFLKFEQIRKVDDKYEINSKKLKFNLVNHKFPIIINPKEVYNLIISIEKNYDYLMVAENLSSRDEDRNLINQLMKLSLSTPICLNILSNKPINNLIWSFLFRWKDEINNKFNIYFKVENNNNLNGIKLYHFFKVNFTIYKFHKEKVKFEFRFKISYDEFKLDKNLLAKENKSLVGDALPDIFPEKKSIEVEMKENEFSKTIEMRYIPVRTEYIEFPAFEIFDSFLLKKYFVFFTNKIYVNE